LDLLDDWPAREQVPEHFSPPLNEWESQGSVEVALLGG